VVKSEAFQAEFNAGNFAQALKLALAEAVELKITTTVVSTQDNGSALVSTPGSDRLYTRFNIVDSEIENEIGSGFLAQEPYNKLLAFHLSQADQVPHLIHKHLQLLGQLSEAISSLEATPDILEAAPDLELMELDTARLTPSAPLESESASDELLESFAVVEMSLPEEQVSSLLEDVALLETLSEFSAIEPQSELSSEDALDVDLFAAQTVSEELIVVTDDVETDDVASEDDEILVLLEDTDSAQDLVADIVSTLELDSSDLTEGEEEQSFEDAASLGPPQFLDDTVESSTLEGSLDDDLAAILSLDTSDESDLVSSESDLDSSLVLTDDTESVEELADDLMAALELDSTSDFQEPFEESDVSSLDLSLLDTPSETISVDSLDDALFDPFASPAEVDLPEGAPAEERASLSSVNDPWTTSEDEAIAPLASEPGIAEFDLSDLDLSDLDLSTSEPVESETTSVDDNDPFQSVFQPVVPELSDLPDPTENPPSDPTEPTADALADLDLSELLAGAEEPDAESPEGLQDALDAWLNLEIDEETEPTAEELTLSSLQSPNLSDDPFQASDDPFQTSDVQFSDVQLSDESYSAPTGIPSSFTETEQDAPEEFSSLDQALSGYEAAAQKTVDDLFNEAFGETDSTDSSDDMFVAFFDATVDPDLDEVNPFGNFSLETLGSDAAGDRSVESHTTSNGSDPDAVDENWSNFPPPPPHSSV
jgi:hypothetical protein